MLAKKYRLPIQLFVAKRGKLVKTPFFLLKIYPTEGKLGRFGVTVSAKTAKKATDRNKLKRMVYNLIREYYKRISPADYWITVSPAAVPLTKENFIKELKNIFHV